MTKAMAIDTTSRPLTPKQEAFCIFVLAGSNQSDAYRKAYNCGGMKAKTVNEKASRMMGRGKIRARVADLTAPVIAQAQMTRTEWLQRLTRCCRFDPRKMFDATGKLKPITELGENEAAAIVGFEMLGEIEGNADSRKKVRLKIQFIDRIDALALIGKACHWYADEQEQSEPDERSNQKSIVMEFVQGSMPAEESYRRMVGGPK